VFLEEMVVFLGEMIMLPSIMAFPQVLARDEGFFNEKKMKHLYS
jgi:hypothetical protein